MNTQPDGSAQRTPSLGLKVAVIVVCLCLCVGIPTTIWSTLVVLNRNQETQMQNDGFSLRLRWKVRLDGDIISTPTASGDMVIARTKYSIYAFRIHDGSLAWQMPIRSGYIPSPVAVGNGIAVAYDSEAIWALDLESGRTIWRSVIGNSNSHIDAITHEGIFRVTFGHTLTVYEFATGQLLWQIPVSDREDASAFADGNTVYVLMGEGLQARSVISGQLLWQNREIRWAKWSAYRDGTLYYTVYQSHSPGSVRFSTLAAFDVKRQTERWRVDLERDIIQFVPDGGYVLATTDCCVWAIGAKDGTRLWRTDVDPGPSTTPILLDNVVYVIGMFSRRLYAISLVDGRSLGYLQTGPAVLLPSGDRKGLGAAGVQGLLVVPMKDTLSAFGE